MKDSLKVTIAGGGSTYTPGIVKSMLAQQKLFPLAELVLYDIDQQKNDDMYVIINYMLEQEGRSEIKLTQTLDPKEAFTNCDFVFSQIRVGSFAMREKDEKIPLKHGCVGQETCGMGGFAYGLRTIGPMLELIGFIQKYAPSAWILNYTNPESIVSECVRRVYPHIRMICACDMTISIEETICDNFGYDRSNWTPTYYGLNHFGWYRSIYDNARGCDVMPEIIRKIKEKGMQVADFNAGDTTWQEAWDNLRKQLEFFPDALPNNYLEYYLFPDDKVSHADPNYTRANMIMDGRLKHTQEMAYKIRHHDKGEILTFNFGEHGNYIVDMAVSILHNLRKRFIVLVANNGAIPNFRPDAVVEVPAYISAIGVEPVALREPIPNFHKGMMEGQNAAEQLLVDGYFEKSYMKVLQAFTMNLTTPSANRAKAVLDDMIVANKEYWPQLS